MAEDSTAQDSGGEPASVRTPVSVYEPDLPQSGEFCAFLAAVECDGSEDCAEGETCCGTVNGGALQYDSIRCQATCDEAAGGRVLCHEGETCSNPEQSCIRSIILPSYLGICGTPSAFTPEGFDAASTAPGEINCGVGLACTGGKICCSLTSWNAETQGAAFIDGRCVEDADECSCSAGSVPVAVTMGDTPTGADAGSEDGGP